MVTAALLAAFISGCNVMSSGSNHGVAQPLTPEQSKAQVVDAANDIVRTSQVKVNEANFMRSSCNDQGDAPFRGGVNIFYARPASFADADADVERMTQRLQAEGWTTDTDFKSHGTVLKKNGVNAVFYPANASSAQGNIELFGECRDVTTTKAEARVPETITFG
jgi:hypothetical protein